MIGAVFAFFIEWGIYDLLRTRIEAVDTLQMFTIVPYTSVLAVIIVAYLIVGFLVGVVGSMLSIRKFLQV